MREAVVSKSVVSAEFGNDAGAMFVRVRRRALKSVYRQRDGTLIKATSASYDVVRAVRINGKPRQKFLFGLGSLKQPSNQGDFMSFWVHAVGRMKRHGLDDERCRCLIDGMLRKSARKPTAQECADFAEAFGDWQKDAITDLSMLLGYAGAHVPSSDAGNQLAIGFAN